MIKDISEITAIVVDYGYFANLAEKLSTHYEKVFYYTPIETEFREIGNCILGDGIDNVERLDDFLDPEKLKQIDLFVFPDTGMAPLQKHLKELGKIVWGSMGASSMEYSRTKFVEILDEVGLPVAPSNVLRGITDLSNHLKKVGNKWVKINNFRANMETWHHFDFAHSQRKLESLSLAFGGAKERVKFLVQDHIETEIETGYDGWCVDGEFPSVGFCGYENKNQAYLAALTDYDNLPDVVKQVNSAFAPLLKATGYRNFFSTEIRIKDGVPYFIDPTLRAAGLALEQQQESLLNIGEIIWKGAQGELIKPKYSHKFAVEATVHYTGEMDAWKTLNVPESVRRWFKADHYCIIDGNHHYPLNTKSDECGVMIGLGNSVDESVNHLKENMDAMKNEPVSINLEAVAQLIHKATQGKSEGVKFSDEPLPDPSIVVDD